MKAKTIIQEIQKLPLEDQRYIVEAAKQLIRKQEEKSQMEKAAEALYSAYLTDPELTAFTY